MGKKKRNILKMLLITLCLLGIMLFVVTAAGVRVPFIEAYKINFKHNITGISNMLGVEIPWEVQLYLDDETVPTPKPTMVPAEEANALEEAYGEVEVVETKEGTTELTVRETVKPAKNENVPVALSGASNYKFANLGDRMVCVSETMYRGYDGKGELLWEEVIQMQNPQITVRGAYVLVNETGAKKLQLYKGKNKIFEAECQENIISADLSKNGDVVAVTEKKYYKGEVVVFNKKGEMIFGWNSGSYNILDVAISPKRKVAVSLLNTDTGADSYVTCLDVNGKEKYKTDIFKNSIIFDVEFNGEKLNAIADDRCIGISAKGKTSWEHSYDGKTLANYDFAVNGSKLLLLESGGVGEIVVVSAGGKKYEPIKTGTMPESVNIKSDYIAYNNGRDVVVTNFRGKGVTRASCGADIKQIHAIEKGKIFCVYSSSVQVKKPVRVKN